MDWVADLRQKLRTLLDIEGVMAMQEDAFDFVEHQLQTIGNSIDNQFQTVSANIENQLQAIRANIEQYCSNFDLNGSESIDAENKNNESTAINYSACSPDLFEEDSKLADVENKNTNSTAQESSMLITTGNNSGQILKKTSSFLDDPDFEDSKLADEENEVTKPTGSDSSMLCTKTNTDKGPEKSFTFLDDSDSYTDEESGGQSYVQYVYWTCPKDLKQGKVIGPSDEEPRLDEICAVVDTEGLCSFCLRIFESYPDKERICEACAGKANLIDQQEQEQPAPKSEAINKGLNLSEDESFYSADFDCDSDWEII